jgi:hypothetical protein
MQQQLRVDPVGVHLMASRWGTSAGELSGTVIPTVSGLSCQASAAAVHAAHGDVAAFTRTLATRVGTRAARVIDADVGYLATEADSSSLLAAVSDRTTSV